MNKKVNINRILAYVFINVFYILLTLHTLISIPTNIDSFNGYTTLFIFLSSGTCLIFGLINTLIIFYISLQDPLVVIYDSIKKKIRFAVYIINTIMMLLFTLIIIIFILISIENLADVITRYDIIKIMTFETLNAIFAALIVNVFLFSLSLPKRIKNEI